MKLTPFRRQMFTRFDNTVFDKLDYNPDKLVLNGSYALPIFSLWSGDVDLYEPVPWSDVDDFLKYLRRVVSKSGSNFHYVKIGQQDYKFRTKTSFLKKTNEQLKQMIQSSNNKRVMLQLIILNPNDKFLEEISIMYDFGEPETIQDLLQSLKPDIQHYMDKNNYYKALKRAQLYYHLREKDGQRMSKSVKDKMATIDRILMDPFNGSLYRAITLLATVVDAKHRSKTVKLNVLDRIKGLLRKIGVMKPSMLPVFQSYNKHSIEKLAQSLLAGLSKVVKDELGSMRL